MSINEVMYEKSEVTQGLSIEHMKKRNGRQESSWNLSVIRKSIWS